MSSTRLRPTKRARARSSKALVRGPHTAVDHDDEPEHRLTGAAALVGRHGLGAIRAAAVLGGMVERLDGQLKVLEGSVDDLEDLADAARDAYLGDRGAAERLRDGLRGGPGHSAGGADGSAPDAAGKSAQPDADLAEQSLFDIAAVVDLLMGASHVARGDRGLAAELARSVSGITGAAVERIDRAHTAAREDLQGTGNGRVARVLAGGGPATRLSAEAAAFMRSLDALITLWQEIDPVTAWWQATDDPQDNGRIAGLSEPKVRAGSPLTLRPASQSPFDVQRPPRVRILVGWPALEARITRWSPQAVEIVVPEDASSGPVFFARGLARDEAPTFEEEEARIAKQIGRAWQRTFLGQHPGLRPAAGWLRPDRRNWVDVMRPPRIVSFTVSDTDGGRVGGTGRDARAARGPRLTLAWQVVSHDPKGLRVQLTRDGKPLREGLPAEGTVEVDTRKKQRLGLKVGDELGLDELLIDATAAFYVRIVPDVVVATQDHSTELTVELSVPDPDRAVRVSLECSAPDKVVVMPIVIIPAGQRVGSIIVRGTTVSHRPGQPVGTMTARADGYDEGQAVVWLDNDKGEWRMVQTPLDLVPVHAALFRNGKVLFFSWDEAHPTDMHKARYQFWDPSTEQKLPAGSLTENVFCAGHCFLPDGRLLVIGGREKAGHIMVVGRSIALGPDNDVHTVDLDDGPTGARWTQHHDMFEARWYPTCITLADGRALLMGGSNFNVLSSGVNVTYELFDWAGGLQSDRRNFGKNVGVYPFAKLLADGSASGKLFVFKKDRAWLRDVEAGEWIDQTFHTHQEGGRTYPTQSGCVLLPIVPGDNRRPRVLVVGGIHHDQGLDTAEIFELNTARPEHSAFRTLPSRLHHPRFMSDAVMLPDGNVLIVNGAAGATGDPEAPHSQGAMLRPEMFNSDNETFETMAPAARPRQYHSVAMLLPDGRVLVSGNTRQYNPGNPIADMTIEVFSPPYLFRGPRPTIDWSPAQVVYDDTFTIGTVLPGDARPRGIVRVALIRGSSTTHSNNMDQRYVALQVVSTDTWSMTVRAPRDATVAPPGYYMLFLVNRNGVPSVGRFLRVGAFA